MIEIPQRASNDSDFKTLSKLDKQIIVYKVLHNASNQDAFRLFHPEYLDGNGRLNAAGQQDCKFFFNYGKNREYIEAYTKTIEEFFGGGKRKKIDADIDDNRIEGALKKLLNQAIGLLDSGDNLDPDSVKTIVEVFRKMNLLKDEEQSEMKPIRVLPTRCKSECRYRLFCETAMKDNLVVDDCDYCRARAFAEENGFKYDPTTVLNLPENIIAMIDEQNDVKLEDIINGKIEN